MALHIKLLETLTSHLGPLSFSSLLMVLGKQLKLAQILVLLHPCGRPQNSSCLLTLAWPLYLGGHLGGATAGGGLSLSISLSLSKTKTKPKTT